MELAFQDIIRSVLLPRCFVQQSSEAFAANPQEVKREHDDANQHRIAKAFAIGKENVIGENVDNDGSEHEQAEIPRAGNRNEDAAKQLTAFDEGHVSLSLIHI